MKLSSTMGALEWDTYRRLWRSSRRLRSSAGAREVSIDDIDDLPRPTETDADPRLTLPYKGKRATLRDATAALGSNARTSWPASQSAALPETDSVTPHRIAASLLFARIFDERPALLRSVYFAAPTILIDFADHQMLKQVKLVWQRILYCEPSGSMDSTGDHFGRTAPNAAFLVVEDVPKPLLRKTHEELSLDALSMARPLIAMSPLAQSYLPEILRRAATDRIEFPRPDQATIVRVIRIVTGKACSELIDERIVDRTTLEDLVIAVRFDRTPKECIAELRRLQDSREGLRPARDLSLLDLHGLAEARTWAEAAISDIKAWKAGRIPWSAVASGIAINGPSGCGKTTFAAAFCQDAGLHMVSATLAKWQSSGEAHLGHLLRAMRQDFEEARARAPSCVFIDEIDSFPARAGVTHNWRDYVVEVVNALLAEIDGIKGRDGVIVIGASNDISRCEPALLRSGRLEKIVTIGVPSLTELELMFRVRLRDDLTGTDIRPIVELAAGMVGADVERVVKDARRIARRDGDRALALPDVREALTGVDDRSAVDRWRACVHEAAHLLVGVVHFGPEGTFATSTQVGSRGGMTVCSQVSHLAGTPEVYQHRLQVLLAGRAGEELLLGTVSDGATRDLEAATSIALAMVGSLGLTNEGHLTHFGASWDSAKLLAFDEVRDAVARELRDASIAVMSLLKAHQGALTAAARQLASQGRITGATVAHLLKSALNSDKVDS